ncbi:MAG: hypothetical protein GX338_06590 [Firmicutes bacterium]|jgi:hypothetical protein|nr:hypothetical protein [Bacillota bacterium]
MSEVNDLISQFLAGGNRLDREALNDLIREFGLSSGDPEKIRSMLHDLGYTDIQLEDVNEMAKVAQDFLASMPDETRNYIMSMAIEAISSLELGEVPPEIQRLFETANDVSQDPGRTDDDR